MSERLITTLTDKDINPNASGTTESNSWYQREAVRAVVRDHAGRIALLYASERRWHKLPGGGIEPGEGEEEAIEREMIEEIGCKVEIDHDLGQVVEYRECASMKQVSHCYTATVVGEKGQPQFTPEETAEGFGVVWTDNIDLAIKTIEDDVIDDDDMVSKFMRLRELAILQEAKRILNA